MHGSKILYILFIALVLSSCDKGINSVNNAETVTPGRRDYIWTIDTLQLADYHTFGANRIWGSGPTDIWLVGSASVSWDCIWHFDGTMWKKDSMQRNISPWALFGFGKDNIWMGNANNSLWRFDGIQWSQFGTYLFPGYTSNMIMNIFGTEPNNVFALGIAVKNGGARGIIMHYDGSQWSYLSLPDINVMFTDIAFISNSTGSILTSSNISIVSGHTDQSDGSTICRLYVYDGKTINELYAGNDFATVSQMNGEAYITLKRKLYKYADGKLALWKDLSNTTFLGTVWGRNEHDFFSFAADGIGHFNGTNFETIFSVPSNLQVVTGTVLGDEVFFPCITQDERLCVVVHGKLPKAETEPK